MNLVQVRNNQPVTSSLQVAEVFEKELPNVNSSLQNRKFRKD